MLPDWSSLIAAVPGLANIVSSFTQAERILRVQFSPDAGVAANALLPHQLTGSEGLCEPLDYRLRCLSSEVGLALKSMEGLAVACSITDDHGTPHAICALVTEAHQLASNGGFVLYELRLEDGLSVLRHRKTLRVFKHQSIVDITRTILDEHIQQNTVLKTAFAYSVTGLHSDYPQREFTLQANESDFDFLTRLWRREGICWYYTHCLDGAWPVHTLTLVDNVDAWQDNPAGSVRFHRADATEESDTINGFQSHRRLIPGAYRAASADYQAARITETEHSAALDQGSRGNALAATLTQYHYDAPHLADSQEHYDQMGERWAIAQEWRGKWFTGDSVVRAFTGAVGTCFALVGHAEIDRHPPDERRFVLTHLTLGARNHLLSDSAVSTALHLEDDSPVYRNEFECVRYRTPIAPEYDPTCVPKLGPMTAIVVAPEGQQVDVDKQGRIEVLIPGTREDEHPSGASTARIRVMQPWADAGYGTAFWPRRNSEVVLTFIGGDPDKPLCMGGVLNADHAPARFAGLGELPGNAALAGIRSQELNGGGAGELLFDDTTGQLNTKLSSDYGATQLNQGCIVGARRDGVATKRGEGFELRSDFAGSIRAAHGLLLSADAQFRGAGKALDIQTLLGLLEVNLSIVKKLAELSNTHGADGTDSQPAQTLHDDLTSWGVEAAKAAPALALSGPAGIALGTPQVIAAAAGQHIDLSAVQDVNISTGRKILLRAAQGISHFAHKLGMKFIAATGKISIQAQADDVEIIAGKNLHLTALDAIHLNAQKVFVNISGASISLADAMVKVLAKSGVGVEAADFTFATGGDGQIVMPEMPTSQLKTDEKVAFASRAGVAREGVPYAAHDETQATRDDGQSKPDGTSETLITDTQIRPLLVKPKV